MSNGAVQLALREWRTQMMRPATLVIMLGVSAIVALAAPFETGEVMRLVPRFAYWLVIVYGSYGAGSLLTDLIYSYYSKWTKWAKIALASLATGVAVSVLVSAVNAVALGFVPDPERLPSFLAPIFAISLIISLVINYLVNNAATASENAPPAILDRLPFDKRGSLLALSVEDHYVRVHTTKGEELILMRLSDAVRETGDVDGAQVHRSHWVSWKAVAAVKRDKDRAILTLSNGIEVPVSRANLTKLKAAGLETT